MADATLTRGQQVLIEARLPGRVLDVDAARGLALVATGTGEEVWLPVVCLRPRWEEHEPRSQPSIEVCAVRALRQLGGEGSLPDILQRMRADGWESSAANPEQNVRTVLCRSDWFESRGRSFWRLAGVEVEL
jgi:hypothetical protein